MEESKTKICCYCGQELPVSEFNRCSRSKDGLFSRCKKCRKIKGLNLKQRERKELYTKGLKKCIKCGEIKPLSEFCKSVSRKDGLSLSCKHCKSEYRLARREYYIAYGKQYYRDNRDNCLKQNRVYKDNNKEHYKEYYKEYYKKNRVRIREYGRKWRQQNSDKCRARSLEYRLANRDAIAEKKKQYYWNIYKDRSSVLQKHRVAELVESYVSYKLKQSGFSPSDITPELIAEKRKQLKLERAYRLLNREINSQQNKE